jgi:exopolysaccharide biosynthesis polyprenyl glycosylphosphotransferase
MGIGAKRSAPAAPAVATTGSEAATWSQQSDETIVVRTSSTNDLSVVERRPVPADPRDYSRAQPLVEVHQPWLKRYTAAVVLGDLVAAVFAILIAVSLPDRTAAITAIHAAFPLLWVLALALGRAYEHRFVGNGSEEYKRLFHAGIMFLAVSATIAYGLVTADNLPTSRKLIVVGIPLAMVLSLVVHWAARQGLHRIRREGRCMQRVVVVGLERSVAELVRTVQREPYAGLQVVAACIDTPRSTEVEGIPVLGDSDHILDVLVRTGADTVAVTAWSDVSQTDLRRLSWDLEGTGVSLLVAPRLTDVSGPRIHIRPVAGLPLLNVEEPEFSGVRRIVKGGLDRVLALAGVLVLLPVLVGVAVAVRLTSRGPVLFRQVRIGRHGKPFVIHKFRSMYVDAEDRLADLDHHNEHDGVMFKIRNDPRVTPVGRFIRRYSLDELPQFFDVLRGRMSLVGPRPPLPTEVARYPLDVRRRLIVKPGITGLWQVSGRSNLSWDDSVRLDLLYVENWSLAFDITIMMKTVLAVLRRDGAY